MAPGNTLEANVYKNLKYLSKKINRRIPIHRGAEKKIEFYAEAVPYHGYDGLGDWDGRTNDEDDKNHDCREDKRYRNRESTRLEREMAYRRI